MLHAEAVESVDHESRLMGACSCGNAWAMTYNEVTLAEGRWVDYIAVRCVECGVRRDFRFDISKFFSPRPRVWAGAGRHRAARVLRFVGATPPPVSMTYGAVA